MICPKCGRTCTKHKQSTVKRFGSREQFASDFCGVCRKWWPSCVPVIASASCRFATKEPLSDSNRMVLGAMYEADMAFARVGTESVFSGAASSRCAAHEVIEQDNSGLAKVDCECGFSHWLNDGGWVRCPCGVAFMRNGYTVQEVG